MSTRIRIFGRDTELGAWMRANPGLLSRDPDFISVTDVDYIVHQYGTYRDRLPNRTLDRLLFVEEKCFQERGQSILTLPKLAQRDTFQVMHSMIGSRKRNRATGPRLMTKRIRLNGEIRNCHFWGVHVISLSGSGPTTSDTVWWDNRIVTLDELTELLGFRRHPYTVAPLTEHERRHHAPRILPLLDRI